MNVLPNSVPGFHAIPAFAAHAGGNRKLGIDLGAPMPVVAAFDHEMSLRAPESLSLPPFLKPEPRTVQSSL